jgi:hypothetical protein
MMTTTMAAIEILLGLPHCTCSWRLRPKQVIIDSVAVINGNPNVKVLDMHT